jgi:DtxR family Mn-dependent transcriptional regulator
MHREDPVSPTHQMYLKALLRLCQLHPVGRVRDLAEELGVTPGTVSTALSRLQDLGLVEREHYGGALLTSSGQALAECVVRRFDILKTLLTEVFGIDESYAESDACLMEHAVSPVTINRITKFLDHLKAGGSIDLPGLRTLYGQDGAPCSECEAEGYCKAAESAVHN